MKGFPERKSDIVRRLVSDKKYKEALRIAKEFRLGISQEDSDGMKRAYECILYPAFYQQLGFNPSVETSNGIEILIRLYGK